MIQKTTANPKTDGRLDQPAHLKIDLKAVKAKILVKRELQLVAKVEGRGSREQQTGPPFAEINQGGMDAAQAVPADSTRRCHATKRKSLAHLRTASGLTTRFLSPLSILVVGVSSLLT